MENFEYLSLMFNVRTYGKKYENYIVNAIYSRINNPELIPVTQQYVKNINDKRKYYLLDLYFPQLNYGVEVDEGQHLTTEHKISDKQRAMNILSAIECEEDRISIFSDDKSLRTIKEINKDIDKIVKKIKNKIKKYESKNGKLKWLTNEELKKIIFKRRILDIRDDVTFRSFVDVYNFIKGENLIKGTYHCGRKLNNKYFLWVPQLTVIRDDGTSNSLGGWKNFLSEDHKEVREAVPSDMKKETKIGPWQEVNKRIVFMKMKDRFGKTCTKFIGVFKATEIIRENKDKIRIYKRINTEINLDELR